jgi:hypothetical protein
MLNADQTIGSFTGEWMGTAGSACHDSLMADEVTPTRAPVQPLWWVERVLRSWYPLVVFVVVTLALAPAFLPAVTPLSDWDWLLVTGVATWLVAVHHAVRLPDKLTGALVRLVNRNVLVGALDLAGFLDATHRRARWSGLIGAAVAVAAIVLSFAAVYHGLARADVWFGVSFEAVLAVPAGLFFGRAASYGFLGNRLVAAGYVLRPDPDHLDGAAGLRPIGSLFFYATTLLAMPGGFLAVWWFLIPLFHGYTYWRQPYALMLLIVVAAGIMVFVLPMVSFHNLMAARKTELFAEADRLSGQAARGGTESSDNDKWQKRYAAIESMPTWPIDMKTRRRFGLRNALLLVPVLAQILGAPKGTLDIMDTLRKMLSG